MRAKIVTAGNYRTLEEALLRDLKALKKGSPFGPVSILTGSNLQGKYLRGLLAVRTGGIFNVDFLAFPDLLSAVERRSLLPALKGLPPFAAQAIVESLCASGDLPEYFSPISGTRGFSEAVITAFSDLSEAGCTCDLAVRLAGRKETGPGLKSLLSLFAAYRRRVDGGGGDIHTRFESAAALKGGGGFRDPLLVYGLYDLNARQWDLLEHVGNSAPVTFYVPWRDEKGFRFAAPLVNRCRARGFDIEEFAADGAEDRWPAELEIFSAPDPEAETIEMAGRVLESAGKGIRFGEMAVALSPGCDGSLAREIFGESGIPVQMAEGSLLESSAHARGALQLCRLLSGDLSRSRLVEFMVSAPLAGAAAPGGGDLAAAWVRESALEGMAGERGWPAENALLAGKLSREAAAGRCGGDLPSAAALAGGIIEKITERGFGGGAHSWSSLAGTLSSLVASLFEEGAPRDEVCRAIEELAGLDSLPGSASPGIFPAFVERALSSTRGFTGRPGGEGVAILPIEGIRGLRFRALFIAGMTEDSIPGTAGRDPFLPDEARDLLEKLQPGALRFSRRSGRTAELELVFRLACSGAGDRLVCGHSRTGAGSGREKARSSFLDLLERESPGERGPSYKARSRLTSAVERLSERDPVTEDEYSLRSAAAHGAIPGGLPGELFFSRGARLEKARWSEFRLTPYDGVLESPGAASRLAAMLVESGGSYSATSLERWAGCPFAFFLRNILRIESIEEPERILSIDPLQRGTLVHSLLQRLYSSLGENGLLPVSPARLGRIEDHASRFIRNFLDEYASGAPVGVPAFWEIDRNAIKRAVMGLLWSEAREEEGFVPALYEEPFGRLFEASPVSFETGSMNISFHGRIDRIDRGDDGRFRVIDYKTGRLSGRDDDMAGGTALQLPVYILAASAILGLPLEKGTALYRKVSLAGGKASVSFDGAKWGELGGSFAAILDVIVRGIGGGLFFMYPDPSRCEYCDARGACPSSKRLLFERKASRDPRAADYLAMREGVEGDE